MLPAFGAPESKALLPIFSRHAAEVGLRLHCARQTFIYKQVTAIWKDMLSTIEKGSCVINVGKPIARASLDAIGEGA